MADDTDEIRFENNSPYRPSVSDNPAQEPLGEVSPYPKPILDLPDATKEAFARWIDQYLAEMLPPHNAKVRQWAEEETAYRALREEPKTEPYVGACSDVIPVTAMAVEPIHARLDTGIFKADTVFTLKGLRKSVLDYVPALVQWVDYYQKHKLNLRRVMSPGILECVKHGTMFLKTVYDVDRYSIQTYDTEWKVVKKTVTRFKGPRVFHVPLQNIIIPPKYQHLQQCPVMCEKLALSPGQLAIGKSSGKLDNIDKVIDYLTQGRNSDLDRAQEESANHRDTALNPKLIEFYEVWCHYDINGDGVPESLVAIYHADSHQFVQLRYNWYFHQRYPYTAIPYAVTNGSIYGIGLCEMTAVFQEAETKWHQMATDNAYLSNTRMWATKRDTGIEHKPKIFAGRVFQLDDPKNDLIPVQMGDTYNSTLQERQNIFGLTEKRTGVSDYLTGRESPIVGSRATATSTMALIQEGTKRVEVVLENFRNGMAEVLENCFYLWIQYGTDGLEDVVFDGDDTADKVRKFFDMMTELNVQGTLAIDLSATDASSNRSVQQQVQLAIVQTMIQYYTQLVQLSQLAFQSVQQMPQLAELLGDIATSARKVFKELLVKYDIRNPDDYLPDLDKYIEQLSGSMGAPANPAGGTPGASGIPAAGGASFIPSSALPQNSNGIPVGG